MEQEKQKPHMAMGGRNSFDAADSVNCCETIQLKQQYRELRRYEGEVNTVVRMTTKFGGLRNRDTPSHHPFL